MATDSGPQESPSDEWIDQFENDFETLEPMITDEAVDDIERDMGGNMPWGPMLVDPAEVVFMIPPSLARERRGLA